MVTYLYLCTDCEIAEEHGHSMRERPEFLCPNCQRKMERDISGGSHALVKGGKFNSDQQKAIDHKDRVDMDHANKVANFVKSKAQPKTQEAFMRRESIKGETQPAPPGQRVVKKNPA